MSVSSPQAQTAQQADGSLQAAHAHRADRVAPGQHRRRSLLALWHLLSLDAPSIATLWTWFIAASCGVRLPLASAAAMFLAVWILYIADRLLDARALRSSAGRLPTQSKPDALEERHYFHAQHRLAFLIAALIAAFALACTVALLPVTALRLYAALGTLLAAYFVFIHAMEGGRRLPKELSVGVFFSAAVFIPTVSRRPELQRRLILPALLFAALCCINCLRIVTWEHGTFRRAHLTVAPPRKEPAFHPLTQAAVRHLDRLNLLLTILALSLAWIRTSPIAWAVALSSSALFVLNITRHRFSRVDLRAAADLALATPLLVALWLDVAS